MPLIDISIPRSFGEILGGLMGAVIDAQAQAARATIDFIEDVGTLEGSIDSGVTHELRNISFNYTKKNEFDQISKFTLELPLLSLVEIPAINIKTAKFSFNYDVVDTKETETEEKSNGTNAPNNTSSATISPKWLSVKKPITMIGKVQREISKVQRDISTKSSTETNAGIKVDIEFEKSSITLGLERVLDMLELAAKEKPTG